MNKTITCSDFPDCPSSPQLHSVQRFSDPDVGLSSNHHWISLTNAYHSPLEIMHLLPSYNFLLLEGIALLHYLLH